MSIASAATVTCGMDITTDVTLTEDLTCPGDGLVVAAEDVTIDLNGYSIIGSSSGTGLEVIGFAATVTDGAITGFNRAIEVSDVGHVTTNRMTLTNNSTGIELDAGGKATVTKSSLRHNGSAISALLTGGIHVSGSDISHNNGGIFFINNGNSLIEKSTLTHNRYAVGSSQAGGVTVTSSTLSNNDVAIDVFQGGSWTISHNKIKDNGIGVLIDDFDNHRTVVSSNQISGNGVGVQFGNEDFGTWSGQDCEVTKNTFRSNRAAGLLINIDIGLADNFKVRANTFIDNGHYPNGIASVYGTIVDDGIHIVGAPTIVDDITLTSNKANKNADYGIEADGVVDGGKNKAHNNGNPDQCLGLNC